MTAADLPVPATRARRRTPPTASLGGAARLFVRFPTPWILTAAVVAYAAIRLAVGGFSGWDLVVVAGLLAIEPFTQWLIHVFVLHARPIRLGRFTLDMLAAVEHRAHHADPRDLPLSLIPLRVLLYGSLVSSGLALLLPTWGLRLTAAATMAAQTLVYEWTHYLIHSDYKPRRALYRRLYTAHRLHHYRNEHYWFGVSRTFADTVLRTSPRKDDVPASPTAKRLLESVTS